MSGSGYGSPMKVVGIDFGVEQAAAAPDVPEAADSKSGKRVAWEGSTRRARLPADWDWRVAETFREHGSICHVCQRSGADEVDHVIRGDDHRLENLRPIHSSRTPERCHVFKTAREAADAKPRLHRPPLARHPGLIGP